MTSEDGAHLRFPGLEPAVGLHPVMDGRPHLFIVAAPLFQKDYDLSRCRSHN